MLFDCQQFDDKLSANTFEINIMRKVFLILTILAIFVDQSFSQRRSKKSATTPVVEDMDPALFAAMKYRLIGPFRGGRSTTVAGIADDIHTYYMGTTGGGVWKTEDGGISWNNISDGYFNVGSVGAIAVAPSDKNILYVGSGSACPRGNISIGDGMYTSRDGGESWTHSGIKDAGSIAKIVVDPRDPEVAYVAVLGNPFGRNSERGVFKTTNGGQSWEKIFYLNDSTGAVDLVMNPENPRILFAGMWRVERKPWTLIDGSTESGLYMSKDSGVSWNRVEGGLPQGMGGRIGVTISPANPDRMWVIQEMAEEKDGGVYRSDDSGKSWTKINRKHNLRQRAWYYNHIHADPNDENTVFINNTGFYKSIDAGKTFQSIRVPHGDNHGMWINPNDSDIMIQCNDGGANVSYNGGKSWSVQTNQPTSEMYRVTVDNQFPYRVYGAQQDNSTISIPSNTPGGLNPKQHWYSVAGGESGHIAVHPDNPDVVYAGNYIGQIDRIDLSKGHQRNVTAYPQMHDGVAGRDIKYRFQWNAPIRISPHDSEVIYHCSQYVHRSTDAGQSWEIISPDLTTNNDDYQDIPGGPVQHDHSGVELYTTIFAFEESPFEKGVMWAGTDDGRVHITRDNGGSWREITPSDFPKDATVNAIELSNHGNGRAFITAYKYRDNDFKPYVYMTNDYGQSWRLLTNGSNGIPANHFTRVVREDPEKKGLLYAGTEFGMYVSFNEGEKWQEFQLNLPRSPITDLVIKGNDLVVSTQGRSFWILDDLSPLHQIELSTKDQTTFLYNPSDAYRMQGRGFRGSSVPQSAPRGVVFNYYLKNKPGEADTIRLTVTNEAGEAIRMFSSYPEKDEVELKPKIGMNQTIWNMTLKPPVINPGSYFSLSYTGGPTVATGKYGLSMTMNGQQVGEYSFAILRDPRWEGTDEDLKEQYNLTVEVLAMLDESHKYIKTLRSIRDQSKSILTRSEGTDYEKSIKSMVDAISDSLTSIENELIQTKNESEQDPINYPPKLDDQIAYLYSTVNSQDARPTAGIYERRDDLRKELDKQKNRLKGIIEGDVKRFEDFLTENKIPLITIDSGQ